MSSRVRGRWTDLAQAFRGVTVTTVSPFVPGTLDLDIAGFDANLRFLRDCGVLVVVPAGNTGELTSLTTDEIGVLAERAVATVGSHAAVVLGVDGDVRTTTRCCPCPASGHGRDHDPRQEPPHPFMFGDGLVAYLEDLRAAVRPAFNVSVIKHVMEQVGLAIGPVRPPLSPVDTATGAAVASMIRAWEDGLGWFMSAGVAVTSAPRSVRSIPPIRGTEVDMA